MTSERDYEATAETVQLYSPTQWAILNSIRPCSAFLSIFGSILIIFMILRGGKQRLERIHNRILLSMSFLDVVASIDIGLGSTLIPKEFSSVIRGSIGNKVTCTISGFFVTMGLSVPIYNAMLCLYYLAVIKYNVSDHVLLRYEPWMHGIAVLIPLTLAILGASFHIFHPTLKGNCFIGDSRILDYTGPNMTYSIPEPTVMTYIARFSTICIFIIAFLTIVISMAMIYLSVRGQADAMKKYTSFKNRNSIQGSEEKKGAHDETFVQACLYVSACLLTYIFPLCTGFKEKKVNFGLMLLVTIFYPLQGFWNLIVYVRPRYILLRDEKKKRSTKLSFCEILMMVLSGKTTNNESGNDNGNGTPSPNVRRSREESRMDILRRSKNFSSPRKIDDDEKDYEKGEVGDCEAQPPSSQHNVDSSASKDKKQPESHTEEERNQFSNNTSPLMINTDKSTLTENPSPLLIGNNDYDNSSQQRFWRHTPCTSLTSIVAQDLFEVQGRMQQHQRQRGRLSLPSISFHPLPSEDEECINEVVVDSSSPQQQQSRRISAHSFQRRHSSFHQATIPSNSLFLNDSDFMNIHDDEGMRNAASYSVKDEAAHSCTNDGDSLLDDHYEEEKVEESNEHMYDTFDKAGANFAENI